MDRRSFLLAGGMTLGAIALEACSSSKKAPPSGKGNTLGEITKGKTNGMQVAPSQQNLPRQNDRLAFALLPLGSSGAEEYQGGTARAWLAPGQNDPAQGPIPLEFHGEGLGSKGIYVGRANFSKAGTWLLYVEAQPNGVNKTLSVGTQLSVVRQGTQPIPGEHAVSVPTPTTSNHRGVNPYCTLKPKPCSMHYISLDVALKNGKPTVVLIGTPEFCESQTCGPVTQVLDRVAKTLRSRVNFIHIEEYANDTTAPAKQQFAPAAKAWHLEEEPAVYYCRPGGLIVDWTVGPSDGAEIRALTQSLLA